MTKKKQIQNDFSIKKKHATRDTERQTKKNGKPIGEMCYFVKSLNALIITCRCQHSFRW